LAVSYLSQRTSHRSEKLNRYWPLLSAMRLRNSAHLARRRKYAPIRLVPPD
jgi:hypothetical protein